MKKNEIPIIDLHCDLLSFLTEESDRSPEDPKSRCSYPQLRDGHVKLQTMAIYTKTGKDSTASGGRQVHAFRKLISLFPKHFAHCQFPLDAQKPQVQVIAAIENASGFAEENESLDHAFSRLDQFISHIGPIFYISFTHDDENRFGGGNMTSVGLKEDGKRLLEWMHGKKIALDFSHTSDRLAHDHLNFIDQHALDIPIIASHSNLRPISPYPRNLPDDLAKEIIRRKGLIGLNLVAPFIHDTDPMAILRHVEYALALGAENALAFGADFFSDTDFEDYMMKKYGRKSAFYPEYGNSSVYPKLLELFSTKLRLSEQQLLKIASQNALNFMKEKIH